MVTFGCRLKQLRKFKNISQQKLAEKSGVSQSLIGYYERDEKTPGADNIVRIARILNVSTDYLLGLTEEQHYISDSPSVHKVNFSRPVIKGRLATDEEMVILNEMLVKMIEVFEKSKE